MKQKLFYSLIVLSVFALNIQAQSWVFTGNVPGVTDFLGSTGTNPLNLKTTNTGTPQPINFYTSNTLRGSVTTTGNIDVNSTNNGYSIGNRLVLSRNTTGIFVAEGAGATAGTSSYSTFVGYQAVFGATCSATGSTCIGSASGYSLTSGDYNSFLGYGTGFKNTTGAQNIMIGREAGYDGTSSGNTSGSDNVFVGYRSGKTNTGGNENILIGKNTDVSASTYTNSIAIGSGAVVNASNSMILGANTITGVGIGYSGASLVANAKLNVLTTGTAYGSTASVYGVHVINSNTGATFHGGGTNLYGYYAEVRGTETATSIHHFGGKFVPSNSYYNIGVYGDASSTLGSTSVSGLSWGGYFKADVPGGGGTSGSAVGVYSEVGSGAVSNIAVYGKVNSYNTGNLAAYFDGDVYTIGGTNSGTGYLVTSDGNFKTNVEDINSPTEILKQLKPKSYYYDTTMNNGLHFNSKKQFGFIAQDLEQVVPNLVYNVTKPADLDSAGEVVRAALTHKAVNYDGFIALLTAAMQSQQTRVDSLKDLLDKQDSINQALQNQINQITGSSGRHSSQGYHGQGESAAIDVQLTKMLWC